MDWQSFGVGAGLTLPLLAIIWRQLNEKIKEHKEQCDAEIARLWDQIGRSSHEGMRKVVHSVAGVPSVIIEIDRDLEALKRKVDQR